MAALTLQPETFNTGVNIFGVTNWLRTLKSIPPWWESFREALYQEMGDPEVDSVRLYKISPVYHADKITKPFMVLQGAQDPRVLQVESDEIVENARNNGVFVEYGLFEDEALSAPLFLVDCYSVSCSSSGLASSFTSVASLI